MRPIDLNPLFAEVSTVKGVGDKLAKLLARLLRGQGQGGARLVDVLFHLPLQVIDRRFRCTISQLPVQGIATLEVTLGGHRAPPRGGRLPYRINAHDDTGSMELVFFAAHGEHLLRNYPEGEKRLISGSISWFNEQAQMTHPDHVLRLDEAARMPQLEPVYGLTAGITNKLLQKVAAAAISHVSQFGEWQDAAWLAQRGWPSFLPALRSLHQPSSPAAMEVESLERTRLAYDELLANQLAVTLVRAHLKQAQGRLLASDESLQKQIVEALPYQLTSAQAAALNEVCADMASGTRMLRLLQGDVGSGKTVVALLALAAAVEAGTQGALMAPTEILARQHFVTLSRLAAPAGLRIALLTGREKGQARERLLADLVFGSIDILIGTHALFQDGVTFKDLGLAVIDEQHRFGVHQRLALQAKSDLGTHLLVMTATPIPRTLALTVYGDMDVSRLMEKPPGRQRIDTRVMPTDKIIDVVEGLRRSVAQGVRAYWVCPLVEESEQLDLAAAQDRFQTLNELFPGQVGLVHGKLKGPVKDAVMSAFKDGEIFILVATTVIEVGVDVPEATIMVIENAERFGLAQLHQLRGRVGRGRGKSTCILLYQDPLGEVARKRLNIMRDSEDGFFIAEEDMKLRGVGEMLGTAQSGLPLFKLADLSRHGDLLGVARDDAALVLGKDPDLASPRGQALRRLLYLFERDAAVRFLSSG